MATYSAQITDLIGGTIDQDACNQWAVDAAKEIILQLPAAMQEQASDKTTVTSATALDFDTATVGKVLYCTRNNGSYDKPCRLVSGSNASLIDDSTASNYYAVADDPAYFLRDNKAEIKPNPDGNGASFYHVAYPSSIDVDVDSTIANFPNEADHLVVLYASIRQLLQYQSTMSTSFNTDITETFTKANAELDETQAVCDTINTNVDSAVTALGNMATEIALANTEVDNALTEIAEAIATTDTTSSDIKTALDLLQSAAQKFRADGGDPALLGDESEYTTGVGMTKVKSAIDKAIAYIDGNSFHADYDLEATLGDVDTELSSATTKIGEEDTELGSAYLQSASGRINQAQTQMAAVSTQINLAQAHISEWNTMVQTLSSEVNAFATEASTRFGWINAKAVVWQGELSAAQGYMATANGYNSQASGFMSAAQGFATEVQTKIAIANGYIAEANARLGADSAKYSWYGDQYTKLQAQYAAGIAALKGT